jgi:protein N-terminal methyltransferase
LDCGAGIGRVSKRLLLPIFSEVDLLEQNPAFLETARTFLVSVAGEVE